MPITQSRMQRVLAEGHAAAAAYDQLWQLVQLQLAEAGQQTLLAELVQLVHFTCPRPSTDSIIQESAHFRIRARMNDKARQKQQRLRTKRQMQVGAVAPDPAAFSIDQIEEAMKAAAAEPSPPPPDTAPPTMQELAEKSQQKDAAVAAAFTLDNVFGEP
jgi:hypothetical protein